MVGSCRVALYCRLNRAGTADQKLSALAGIATERDWTVVTTFYDRTNLLQVAARREFDIVVAPSLDQLGDSLREVVATVHQLRSHGAHLYVHEQGLDTSSPAGPAVLSVFTALAECERAHIRERARVGLERARRTGTRIGRPSNANPSVKAAIVALHGRGASIRQIARQLKVGNRTVYGALEAARDAAGPRGPRTSDNGFGTPQKPLERAGSRVPT